MRNQKSWKEIEMDRNRRLTVTQIFIPVLSTLGGIYAASPELRKTTSRFFQNIKWNIKGFKGNVKTKFKDWKSKKEEKKKSKSKNYEICTKDKLAIMTMLNEIEIHCDDDYVMSKCNKIRKVLGED